MVPNEFEVSPLYPSGTSVADRVGDLQTTTHGSPISSNSGLSLTAPGSTSSHHPTLGAGSFRI